MEIINNPLNDIYYKGFVRLGAGKDHKGSIDKYKEGETHTLDEISSWRHIGGVLNGDIVLVDVDIPDQAKRFVELLRASGVKCRIIKTTKGVHALFKDDKKLFPTNYTKQPAAIGIKIDVKAGVRASYEALKLEGEWREIIQDCDAPDYPPKWLKVIKGLKHDFYTMSDGDGRNNALFGYISTLKNRGFSKNEAFECIRLMNDYIMQYPLEESELNVVLRPEAFPEGSSCGGRERFEHWTFGDELIEEYNIRKIDDIIHIYKDGIYVPASKGLEGLIIDKDATLTAAKRTEVSKYIAGVMQNKANTPPTEANFIAFRNGLYDIDKGILMDFTPEMIITNRIEYDYVEGAYCELADKTLNKLACQDEAVRALLEEIIGYCFYRRSELRKSFILIGDKANGKSTYLDMIKTLLGDDNTSAVDLQELGDRFKTAELVGKLANIGDDIGDEFIGNPAVFKKLASGDRLNVEYKGLPPFNFNNYAKLLFSANTIPRIKDRTRAVIDRMVIVPFDARFSKKDPDFDPHIKYKLREPEVMEYLIVLGIEGLKRVLVNQGFTECARVQEALDSYDKDNNPIRLFFEDVDFESDILNQPVSDVYFKYDMFCTSNKFQPLGNIAFSRAVKREYPNIDISRIRVQGKIVKIFKST